MMGDVSWGVSMYLMKFFDSSAMFFFFFFFFSKCDVARTRCPWAKARRRWLEKLRSIGRALASQPSPYWPKVQYVVSVLNEGWHVVR